MRDIGYKKAMFENWKDKVLEFGIDGINKTNSDLIMSYIFDMEEGKNTGKSKRGNRSHSRLNISKQRLIQISKMLEERGIKNISKVTSNELSNLFNDMRKGKIEKVLGGKYSETSIADFIKIYKAFFNWFRRSQKRDKNILIEDVTEDLSGNYNKTRFVYLTKEQKDELIPYLTYEEQLFANFLWDSLIRTPNEVFNLRVKDVYEKDSNVWINIPDEISKTFGRVFNLLYCGEEILRYIKSKELKEDDYLFSLNYKEFNRKIKEIAIKLWGDKISNPKSEKKYSELSGYDFRHCGAIHLRQIAQKNNAISLDSIRQRAGWTDFTMLNYYTQFLGLTGEIKKESLLMQEDKTKLELELDQTRKEMQELKNQTTLVLQRILNGSSELKDSLKYFEIEDKFPKVKPMTLEEFEKLGIK